MRLLALRRDSRPQWSASLATIVGRCKVRSLTQALGHGQESKMYSAVEDVDYKCSLLRAASVVGDNHTAESHHRDGRARARMGWMEDGPTGAADTLA